MKVITVTGQEVEIEPLDLPLNAVVSGSLTFDSLGGTGSGCQVVIDFSTSPIRLRDLHRILGLDDPPPTIEDITDQVIEGITRRARLIPPGNH